MEKLQIYGDRFFEADGKSGETTTTTTETNTNGKDLPDEVKKQLDRLAHLEKENKDLIASRDKAKEAKRKEEEDKLKQQGELQKLLDAKELELTQLKTKADAFEELRTTEIDEAKKALGDKWLDEYANLSLTALRKTVQLFQAKSKVATTDNGEVGDVTINTLTAEQKKEAYEKFPYLSKEKAEENWAHILKNKKVK